MCNILQNEGLKSFEKENTLLAVSGLNSQLNFMIFESPHIRLRSLRISATSVVHLHETKTAEDKQELGQEV